MLNSTPRTWVAGETVTAAEMNAEIRDAFVGVQSSWTSYSPTPSFTVGNGVLNAAYTRFGKTVHVRVSFTAGSTSAFPASGTLLIPLPVAPAAGYGTGFPFGPAFFLDSSVGSPSRTAGTCNSSGSSVFFVTAKDATSTVTDTVPWTWATGDQLMSSATYEAA